MPKTIEELEKENAEQAARIDILRKVYLSQFHENLTLSLELAQEKSEHAVDRAEKERLHTILESCFEPGGSK